MVTVDGAGSRWTNSGTLTVGGSGSGTLNVTNGGIVSTTGASCRVGFWFASTGVVTVDGAGSRWTNSGSFIIGGSGSATLNITNGGTVSSAGAYIGSLTGSRGLVTVDGVGSRWTSSGSLTVGWFGTGMGTLSISNSGIVNSSGATIGSGTGSTGVVTVDGAGSRWTNSGSLIVGNYGNGILNIAKGSAVEVVGATYVGRYSGTMGTIQYSSGGGTLTTQSLYASPIQLTGTGTVNARGLVSDIDLVFDSTRGLSQSFTLSGQGQNITLNLDMSGASGAVGDLGAGYWGSGSLTIRDGVSVNSKAGFIGYGTASTGVVTLSGTGSTWTTSGSLTVGDSGNGTLNITNGGAVRSSVYSCIGVNTGSRGLVTVDGAGSRWTADPVPLAIGSNGRGTLNITNGGAVTTGRVSINSTSLLAMDVGRNSTLTSSGTFTNNGRVRLSAGAGVAAGTYAPISAGTWSGSGTFQAVGGKWDASTRVLNVVDAQTGTSGSAVSIDRALIQRILVDDSTTEWKLGASFLGTSSSASTTLAATAISGGILDSLRGVLDAGEQLLSGWTYSVSGYATGDPIYLSLSAGWGPAAGDLSFWRYVGPGWTAFTPSDRSYDGVYASFTVDELVGGYAVSAVPEPAGLVLLVAGAGLARRWRRGTA